MQEGFLSSSKSANRVSGRPTMQLRHSPNQYAVFYGLELQPHGAVRLQSQVLWQAPDGERLKEKRARALLSVLLACGGRSLEKFPTIVSLQCIYFGIQATRSHPSIQSNEATANLGDLMEKRFSQSF